jgi:hypothetical protein
MIAEITPFKEPRLLAGLAAKPRCVSAERRNS